LEVAASDIKMKKSDIFFETDKMAQLFNLKKAMMLFYNMHKNR